MNTTTAFFERYGPKYRWLATATVLLGLLALGMSITIVNVATPYIKGAFAMGDDQVQWLSTGFLAATTGALLVAPWCLAAFGARYTYVGLLILFIFASFLGAFSTDTGEIIFARILQGVTTGLIRPVALVTLYNVFPPQQRGLATALFSISLGLPLTLASVIGGWLVDNYTWPYVFFVTLPLCFVAIVLAFFFMPTKTEKTALPPLDWIGTILIFSAIFSILAALANGQRLGWDHDLILILLTIFVLCTLLFLFCEKNHKTPILDLRIFLNRGFLYGFIALFSFGGAFYGIMYLLPQFVQSIQGYSPITAGLLFIPSTFVLAILVPLVGILSDRFPAHYFTIPSVLLGTLGVYQMAHADVNMSFTALAVAMMFLSATMAAFPAPTLSKAIAALPPHLVGYGPGAANFALQLGGAFGTNFLVIMLDRRTLFHSDIFTATLTPDNTMALSALQQLQGIFSTVGTSSGQWQAAAIHFLGRMDQAQAMTFGFRDGFLLTVVLMVSTLVPSWLLSRTKPWSGPVDTSPNDSTTH